MQDLKTQTAEVRDNPLYLKQYLASKGIDPESRRNFSCLRHDDGKTPNMSYDSKRNRVKCFSCGYSGSIIDLIGDEQGLTADSDKIKATLDYFNLSPTSTPLQAVNPSQKPTKSERIKAEPTTSPTAFTKQIEEVSAIIVNARKHVAKTDYYTRRGIGTDIIEKYNLGYDPIKQVAIIPIGNAYYIQRATNDEAETRYYNLKDAEAQLLNTHYLQEATEEDVIFIVEGAIDALSIEEVGGKAIALNSTSNERKFVAFCKEHKPQATLVLSLDNDEAGYKATQEIIKELKPFTTPLLEVNVSGSSKDPNEALVKDRNALKSAVQAVRTVKELERETYQRNNTAFYIADFLDGVKNSVNTEATPSGFTALDQALDGGLYEGLYILGAISSLGKTTLLLQIADQVAETGRDVLIFSLEMARYELMAKSISRLTSVHSTNYRDAKTARGITTGKRYTGYSKTEQDLIKTAVEKYRAYAEHIYIHEGMGDLGAKEVRQAVQKHVSLMSTTPLVLVDYLQLLAPYDPRATDKQNTDKTVLELKRISRDFKLPLMAVSSFNRANYKTPVAMEAFKESGAIEYSSDVLLGLQFQGAGSDADFNELKSQDPRQVELVVLKNRNGRMGDVLPFQYYPLFNRFVEPGTEDLQRVVKALV